VWDITVLQGGVFMHVRNSKTAVPLILTLLSLCAFVRLEGAEMFLLSHAQCVLINIMLFEILIWQLKKSLNDDTYLP
jgi:hypothetical protein